MAEYIEREAAMRAEKRAWSKGLEPSQYIEISPDDDVAPWVHGKWLRSDDDLDSLTTIRCSICGEEWCFETIDDVTLLNYSYCPNCGARMDGVLHDFPAADVAPVVRCKDCKYWQDNNGGYPHEECRWGHGETPEANDFCSYGEQKDGDDDAKEN